MHSRKWMKIVLIGALSAGLCASGQEKPPSATPDSGKLSTQWEELTGPDFIKAIQKAQGVCLLPFGILEKHGPHLPIGTDLINARWVALHSAADEYAVVFPAYYFGQIDGRGTSQARWPTAGIFSSTCCRKPPTKWAGTDAGRSSS